MADVIPKGGEQTVSLIKEQGREAVFVQTDVRIEQDIVRLMKTVNRTFGQIDVLINNAGKSVFKSPFELATEEWDDIINTNLRRLFWHHVKLPDLCGITRKAGQLLILPPPGRSCPSRIQKLMLQLKAGLSPSPMLCSLVQPVQGFVNTISPGWIETGDYSKLRKEDHEQHFSMRVGKRMILHVHASILLQKRITLPQESI